jgi:hypothetical protein
MHVMQPSENGNADTDAAEPGLKGDTRPGGQVNRDTNHFPA